MRIRISHETSYRYDAPTHGVIQTLRLTPRNHDGQFVADWRIDVSEDARLDVHEDAFGNITHTFSADGPFGSLSVYVEGEVDVQDTAGIVRGAV
jgi:transglutaminase-like putative cysteine protease